MTDMTMPDRRTHRRPAHSQPAQSPAVSTEPTEPTDSDAAEEQVQPGFDELGVPSGLVAELVRNGVNSAFPIQAATLPDALAGRDVLGRGRTGSGKTLAFGLAMIAQLSGSTAAPRRPLGLVLVPTRELAQQVRDALRSYGRTAGLRLDTVVGGTSIQRQVDALRRGVEVLVATPGRLTDLIDRRACDLGDVTISVLDEADQMADMGFLPAVSALLDQTAPGGQRLLFSATLDRDVDKLVRRYLTDPVKHSVDPSSASVTTMTHHLLHVAPFDKQPITAEIAGREGRTLMFVRTKHGADRLAKQLNRVGVPAAALHGGKTQGARTRTLDGFKSGRVSALIATDVAARGIHVDGIDLVVNVDPPAEAKDYLHRGGRTARAGESGKVITIVLPDQRRSTQRLLSSAGIRPEALRVRSGDADLVTLTGSCEPSGIAIADPTEEIRQRPARTGGPGRSGPRRRRNDGGHGPRRSGRRTPSTS